jgi:xylulokinase
VSRPQPGFSEQDPHAWWNAVLECLDELKAAHGRSSRKPRRSASRARCMARRLLDAKGDVLRPCILWNDGRSAAQCEQLTREWRGLRKVTGNLAMPGFTAPKLMWVREHEPEVFAKVAMVLLPKAYVRYRLCGAMVEEMSDASGTLWLDVGKRDGPIERSPPPA